MRNSLEYENRDLLSSITLENKEEFTIATILVFDNSKVDAIDTGDVLIREFYTQLDPEADVKAFKSHMRMSDDEISNDTIVREEIDQLEKQGFKIK